MQLVTLFIFFYAGMADPYAPLSLYNGTWQVTRQGAPKPDKLVNQCAKVGTFYNCAQSVNGGPAALLVFIPVPEKPGHYYTQNIRPEGRATARGDLEIDANQWTFLSNWDDSGHTVYYRTINKFVTRAQIHFEQSESTNKKDWKITGSGDEIRQR